MTPKDKSLQIELHKVMLFISLVKRFISGTVKFLAFLLLQKVSDRFTVEERRH